MNRRLMLVAFCVVLAGCEKRRETTSNPILEDDRTHMAMVVFDLSGSFSHLMADRGKGYEFALGIVDRFFRDRVGTHDRLVIAQISGTRSLLWEGTPLQLRRDFPTASQFRDFLLSRADPNQSLVHDGLSHALNYFMSDAAIASGKAKTVVFVLSDMVENGPNPVESEQRLVASLTAYGKLDGVVGLYYVDQFQVASWRERLRQAGIERCTVESEIHGRPTLPSFE